MESLLTEHVAGVEGLPAQPRGLDVLAPAGGVADDVRLGGGGGGRKEHAEEEQEAGDESRTAASSLTCRHRCRSIARNRKTSW
jgi:hypothetical protein